MKHSLIIDPNRVIVRSLIRKPSDGQKREYDTTTLLFDKEQKAFWSLSVDDFGPMAISWDGKRMIRFDGKAKAVNEFSIKRTAELSPGQVARAAQKEEVVGRRRQIGSPAGLTPWMNGADFQEELERQAENEHYPIRGVEGRSYKGESQYRAFFGPGLRPFSSQD